MAITPGILTASILGSAPDLVGKNWFLLAGAVGGALPKWFRLPSGVFLTGVVTGVVGGGVVSGKIFLPPSPLPLPATFLGVGFAGPEAMRIATGIGLGVSTAINSAGNYAGVATGAIGSDTSKVVFADPVSLTGIISAELAALGFLGPSAPLLASGIANGISTMLLKGTGTGVATGTPGPSPGVGVSKSLII